MQVVSQAERPRVLVLDDEPAILDTTERAFRRKFDLTTFLRGSEALEALASQSFDIALVDYMMPGMNGVTFCQQAAQVQPTMRRIMVTAHVDLDDIESAVQHGIVHRLVLKPWTRAELEQAVREELARRD